VNRQRVRIRFSKEGDLRLIGHRDLAQVFERMFRRCGFPLRMSEGFHPKPKVSYPLALALGVEGQNEVMEVELTETIPADEIEAALARTAPEGLVIRDVALLPEGRPKLHVDRVVYEMPIPAERREALQVEIERFRGRDSVPLRRNGRKEPIDLAAHVESIDLADGRLRIELQVVRTASARPAEIVAELGVDDLLARGHHLSRTQVKVAS
jgi:radical SAM-linked protein